MLPVQSRTKDRSLVSEPMEGDNITFFHSGDLGDFIAGLCAVKEICETKGKKAIIVADPSGGLTTNSAELNEVVRIQTRGRGLKMNERGWNFIKPLVEYQPYVEKTVLSREYDKGIVDYNLNSFRKYFSEKEWIRKTNQNLVFLQQIACGLDFGYKGPWLFAPDVKKENKTVACRSTRYQSSHPIYEAIDKHLRSNGVFIGTEFELSVFKNCFGIDMRHKDVKDALEAAKEIKSSELAIFNSSLFYWIAVGLGHPNIMHELPVDVPCSYFPNQNPKIRYFQGVHFLK